MTTVTMTMTDRQAECVVDALDLYCRIGLTMRKVCRPGAAHD